MENTITLMTTQEFRDDADHNYLERLANTDNEQIVVTQHTLPKIEDAIDYLDQHTTELSEELTDDISFGIGCAIENTIENYCRIKYGSNDEDMGDGRVGWVKGVNGNEEEFFSIAASQEVRVNGANYTFAYTIEELRYIDWSDDEYIDYILHEIRKLVDDIIEAGITNGSN